MKIGIVGSRSFPQTKLIEWFIRDLPNGVVIVSGGAKGVDSAAETYAKARGLETEVFLPDLSGCKERYEFTKQYYARNQRIVDASHMIVAFTEKDKGGTWDTIKRARKAGKPVKIIRPSVVFPGDDPDDNNREIEETAEVTPKTGKGPFQIRRASLGSYALRRKCYIDSEEWAGIIVDKEHNPQALADRIAPDMIDYFANNKRFGYIHAITVAPRSTRNLDRQHPMDLVARHVAETLGCEFVRMFEPWEKSSRGRHARHGQITVTPAVAKYLGKVVWVLDDVYTTGQTMRAAVQGLIALEIHAHGLAWVYMA